MLSLNPYPALRRKTAPLAGKAVLALLATAVMVAGSVPKASESELHGAAPRFSQMVVVTPRHAANNLLPVVKQDDILPKHQVLADRVLRALPHFCRDNLKNFYVNYAKNPANRGLGGEDTIIVAGKVPDNEFMALIVHECGHVTDLGGLRGDASSGISDFYDGSEPIFNNDPSIAFYRINWLDSETTRLKAKDTDFVSGYSVSDPFENFAEAYAFHFLQKESFKKLAAKNPVLQAQYDFMDQVVFADMTQVVQGKYVPGRKVPWDVTRLPYVWHAKK